MKKFFKFILIIILLAGVAVGVIEGFARFAPDVLPIGSLFYGEKAYINTFFGKKNSLFAGSSYKEEQELKYYEYLDSLDALDFAIRTEVDSKVVLIHRERQKQYRDKLEAIRTKLDGSAEEPPTEAQPTVENLSTTILTALAIPIGILIVLIIVVIYLIRKKKPLPNLPHESKPSLTKRFDDAIAQANSKKRPESISTMLKTLNETLAKKQLEKSAAPEQPQAVVKDRKVRPKVVAESNVLQSTSQIPIQSPAPTPIAQHKNTESGKIEIITPSRLKESVFENESNEEVFEKEAQVNTDVIKLARRGYTSSEIARRLRISQDQVDLIIRMQREE